MHKEEEARAETGRRLCRRQHPAGDDSTTVEEDRHRIRQRPNYAWARPLPPLETNTEKKDASSGQSGVLEGPMRSCVQRFQWRWESHIFSQLCSVSRGRPAYQAVGFAPRSACRRFAASSVHEST